MHLRPLGFLLLDNSLEEVIRGFWGVWCELIRLSPLSNEAKVIVDFTYYASLFPGFAFGRVLGGCLVRLPAAFWEDPAVAFGGLDEEHVVLVGRKGDNARNESLALGAISCESGSAACWGYNSDPKKGEILEILEIVEIE